MGMIRIADSNYIGLRSTRMRRMDPAKAETVSIDAPEFYTSLR